MFIIMNRFIVLRRIIDIVMNEVVMIAVNKWWIWLI